MASKQAFLGWLISGLLAGITYIYPDEIRAFIDSIVPNAGYFIVRLVFVLASAYFAITLAYQAYKWKRKNHAPKPNGIDPRLLKKLEALHSCLLEGPSTTASYFEYQIERPGYLKMLKDASPELVVLLDELKTLVKKLENEPATEGEARRLLGDQEYERSRTYHNLRSDVFLARMRENSRAHELADTLKTQVQNLIAS